MAERERSRDRPTGHHPSGSASGSGPLSSILSLISSRTVKGKTSAPQPQTTEELLPQQPMALSSASDRQDASFKLDTAIRLMEPSETQSSAELCRVIETTTRFLVSHTTTTHEDVFQANGDDSSSAAPLDHTAIRTLYIRSAALAKDDSVPTVRLAATRLLGVLLDSFPLKQLVDEADPLRFSINVRSLYKVISIRTTQPTAELTFAQVKALELLSNHGAETAGLDGIVGWLVKAVTDLSGDWVAWCKIKDGIADEVGLGPISSAPATAAIAIIQLLDLIIGKHAPLFSPADLTRVVQPILDFLSSGVDSSATPLNKQVPPFAHYLSPKPSVLNSPVPVSARAFGADPSLERSFKEAASAHGTPTLRNAMRQSTTTTTTANSSPRITSSRAIRSPPLALPHLADRWTRIVPAFCAIVQMLIEETALSDDLFDQIVVFICFCLGQDDVDRMPDTRTDAMHQLLLVALGPKSGRQGELAVRNILEGKAGQGARGKQPHSERKVTRGAVIAARSLATANADLVMGTPLVVLAPSLRTAQSTSRFLGDDRQAERLAWQPVDYEILSLLQDHLFHLESAEGEESPTSDPWTEGDAACDILRGLIPVATGHKNNTDSILPGIFVATLHLVPDAISRRHSSASSSLTYYHPKYIDLLLDLAPNIDEEDAAIAIDYYQRECLCLPFTRNWIKNIWKLIQAFYLPVSTPLTTRKRLSRLLLTEVYGYAEDLLEHRIELVHAVIVPFAERILLDEKDGHLFSTALTVLVNAIVAETVDRDEDWRRVQASKTELELDDESDAVLPSGQIKEAAAGGSFPAIRALIIKLATQTACKDETASQLSRGASLKFSGKSRDGPSALRGMMSPPPDAGTVRSPPLGEVEYSHPTSQPQNHIGCRSSHAITSLISIFSRLSFASPQSLRPDSASRTPSSLRSITIYRDLLGLLYPMTDDTPNSPKMIIKVPARCPKARIMILQWLMRLRADHKHRIYLCIDLDEPISLFAAILKRTKESEAEGKGEVEDAKRRGGRAGRTDATDERGRASPSKEETTRSRSGSRQAAVIRGTDSSYNPLWRVPEVLDFEMPPHQQPSPILRTYNPNHPSLKLKNAPLVEDVWLPVSEYVRALNGILRGHDWELVSYVLCFLPLQLGNKLFFHGGRATKEIRALLDVLGVGVLGSGSGPPWEKRFNHPTFIRKIDINAAAYQSLSILIAYRGVFTAVECERLVQAFMAGLQGKGEVAKPCLQALYLAIFELPTHIGRHLTTIIDSMKNILSTTGLAVHILEFLLALGQNGNLFRNFTEDQYRLVFVVAINYIAEHNARSDKNVELIIPTSRESFTLSQHVIGLAYYAIYIWFLAINLNQRSNLVPEIMRELIKSRSQRVRVDEMAEVCFDWLARYTYGNADPKPSTSFLSDVVMQEGPDSEPAKSQSWLLGGGIITVTAHPRTGWATVTTTRPTGATTVVCKLENVPLLDVGEDKADLMSLPAVLMANRSTSEDSDGLNAKDVALAFPKPGAPSLQPFDASSQHGYIWSGATPSQRRKDVVVEPSYLALQLLSSYPNASLETPRGRIIPNEEKFMRILRGMQNTPVIDALKISILYVGPGQTTETEILGNMHGSPLYLDFLAGLGRLIRLKGQVDVFVGGLDRVNDVDGEYAYAWFDDLSQMIFHTPTIMPNQPGSDRHDNKKRHVGNDYVKIVYNDSGRDFAFDTIKTNYNLINIVISPHTTGAGNYEVPADEEWSDWDREDWFKVTLQRAPGIPDFSPIGSGKLVSRRSLPIMVRQIAHLANDMAARFTHIRNATDATEAEYITSWRARLRALERLRTSLPPVELPDASDTAGIEQLVRDFTRTFSYRPPPSEKE